MQDHNLTKDLQEQDVGHLPDMVLMWFYCYCWCLCLPMCGYTGRPGEAIRDPGAGPIGCYELLDVDAGN